MNREGYVYQRFVEGNSSGNMIFWDEHNQVFYDLGGFPLDPNIILKQAQLYKHKGRSFIVANFIERECSWGSCERLGIHERFSDDCYAVKNEQPKRVVVKPGYIYVVRCGNKIKVGRSTNLAKRLSDYRRLYPNFRTIAIAKVNDSLRSERDIMSEFGGKADKKEWFDYSPERERSMSDYILNRLEGELADA